MDESSKYLLLISYGSWDNKEITAYHQLAQTLSEHLHIGVRSCFVEHAHPSIFEAIEDSAQAGAEQIVTMPLALEPDILGLAPLSAAVYRVNRKWPGITYFAAPPLGTVSEIVGLLSRLALQMQKEHGTDKADTSETALVVVGRGNRESERNAELARATRLLWEVCGCGWAEYAFADATPPSVPMVLHRCRRLGMRRIVVLPALLFAGQKQMQMSEQVRTLRESSPLVEVLLAPQIADCIELKEMIIGSYQQALSKMSRTLEEISLAPGNVAASHHDGKSVGTSFLPPRYRNGSPVSATPMGAASLHYGADGNVAWNEMWGSDDPKSPFCELALAGGPPHRGTLLEPVAPETVTTDPSGYSRVLAELQRGIEMIANLPTLPDRYPGWIGMECESEAMALWLLRAILVENISVRREANILFFPAGPSFRLEYEIKNVITALAKTHHYWLEHIGEESFLPPSPDRCIAPQS